MTGIRVVEDSDAVRILFDRPHKRNAIDPEMSAAIRQALDRFLDKPVPLIFASATPGMFVAGTDVDSLRTRTVDDSLARHNATLFERIWNHPWPTIAAVDGPALGGGCELALACDFRVASASSVWGLPEVRLGIIPSAGALVRLPLLIGHGLATDLIMTGRRIDGAEAHRVGLVQRLASGPLDEAVAELLGDIGKTVLPAVRLAKEAMRVDGDRARLVDAAAQALCIASDEAQRRLAALTSKA